MAKSKAKATGAVELLKEQRWDVIPGAESATSISTRVRGALDRIVGAHPGQCVAIFSHGGIIGEILAQGSSQEILRREDVRAAYFGADTHAAH